MKKIYIFAAVLALLALSLNAQLNATKKKVVAQPKTTTEKVINFPLDFKASLINTTSGPNNAPKRATETNTSTLTFTARCNGSGTADDGTTWTVTSDANESTFDNTRGIHYGTNSASVSYLQLSTSAIPGTITNIVVNASRGGSRAATVNVTVGGATFGSQQTITTSAANYTFAGSASGNIVVRISKTSSSTGALYCKSIAVTYETETGDTETSDLTVCDGQYYAEALPVYGYFYDEAEHNQMVYPASLLGTAMRGKTIKKMTFYPTTGTYTNSSTGATTNYSGINFYGGSVTFKLMNLSSGTSAFADENPTLITGTMTQVATVVPVRNTSATTWVITFNQDFVYTGGDLLIDVTTVAGSYSHSYFVVDEADANRGAYNVSYNGTNYNYGADFLPKVTFTYEGEADPVHDLAIALDAQPTTVGAGGAVTLTATVTNNGDFDETGYTVTFTANGTTIATQTANTTLPMGQSTTFTYTYTTTDADAGTVNFGASVACADDIDDTNNTATASTQVITLPPPENVAATASGNSGTMTWDAPIIPSTVTPVTETFENTASDVLPSGWTAIDSDGDGYNWYHHININDGNNVSAHNGVGAMASESYNNDSGAALSPNNWLITPQVVLDGTFSFWAVGQDANYASEVFGVYVTTSNDPTNLGSYVQVAGDFTATSAYTQYTANLSAYAGQLGYIAIVHHNVRDMFILAVDDVTYQVGTSGPQPISYNIYLDGQLVGNVDANTFSYTFNNLEDGTYECSVSAVYALGESAAVPATFTIATQQDQTDAPVITVSEPDANGNVTVTATGDGTVTLTIDGQTVTGQGSASITLPQHMQTYTVTASATAQETGELVSPTTTQQVTVPGRDPNGEWTEMDGTYDDPNTLLSFLKDGEDIMLLDQFVESTLNNEQPAGYIYTLKEDQNGETKTSTPVPIPVYKTSSTMQGFYTYNQIITDTDMHLKPQVINSKMTYDVAPDGNVLYYNLYRGNVGEEYPVIDDTHRVSKLQQFEEQVGSYSQFFLFESETSGVTPRYDHVGNEIVERLDTNYVQGVEGNEISYVPVIWTLGINSARGDGKNNSYGSDIKREILGAVEPYSIEIERSNGSSWGKWTVPGTTQEYCVYIPTVTINGTVPAMMIANDGDKSTYVPFMYRAWVTYPAARAFSTDSETGSLIDLGPMELPHLLGTEYSESAQAVITDKWDPGDGVLQCSFGGPADEYVNYDDVTFVVRLYYKKVVTEGDNTGSRLGDDPDDAEEYYIVQGEGSATDIETALREMFGAGAVPVSVTYVNAQGMQSSKPFDGLNIVVTRYSDGSTTTSKMVR